MSEYSCVFALGSLLSNFFIALLALWVAAFRSIVRRKSGEAVTRLVDGNIIEVIIASFILVGFVVQLCGILS